MIQEKNLPMTAGAVQMTEGTQFPVVKITVDCDKPKAKAIAKIGREIQVDARRQAAVRMLLEQFPKTYIPFGIFDGNPVLYDGVTMIAADGKKVEKALEKMGAFQTMMQFCSRTEVAELVEDVIPVLVKNNVLSAKVPWSTQFLRVLAIRLVIKTNPIFGVLDYVDEIESETLDYVTKLGLITAPCIDDGSVDRNIKKVHELLADSENFKKMRRVLTELCDHDRDVFDGFCKWIARVQLSYRFYEKVLKQSPKLEVLTTNAVTFVELVIKELSDEDNVKVVQEPVWVLQMTYDVCTPPQHFVPQEAIVEPNGGPVVNQMMPSMTSSNVLIEVPKTAPTFCQYHWINLNSEVTVDAVRKLERERGKFATTYSLRQLCNPDKIPFFIEDKFVGKLLNLSIQDDIGIVDADVLNKLVAGEAIEHMNEYLGSQQFLSSQIYTVLSHTGTDIVQSLRNAGIAPTVTCLGTKIRGDIVPFAGAGRLTADERLVALTVLTMWGLALSMNKELALDASRSDGEELVDNPLKDFLAYCCTEADDAVTTRSAFFEMYKRYFVARTGVELVAADKPKFYADNELKLLDWKRKAKAVSAEVSRGYALPNGTKAGDKFCFIVGYELKPWDEVEAVIRDIETTRMRWEAERVKRNQNPFIFIRHIDRVLDFVRKILEKCAA